MAAAYWGRGGAVVHFTACKVPEADRWRQRRCECNAVKPHADCAFTGAARCRRCGANRWNSCRSHPPCGRFAICSGFVNTKQISTAIKANDRHKHLWVWVFFFTVVCYCPQLFFAATKAALKWKHNDVCFRAFFFFFTLTIKQPIVRGVD